MTIASPASTGYLPTRLTRYQSSLRRATMFLLSPSRSAIPFKELLTAPTPTTTRPSAIRVRRNHIPRPLVCSQTGRSLRALTTAIEIIFLGSRSPPLFHYPLIFRLRTGLIRPPVHLSRSLRRNYGSRPGPLRSPQLGIDENSNVPRLTHAGNTQTATCREYLCFSLHHRVRIESTWVRAFAFGGAVCLRRSGSPG